MPERSGLEEQRKSSRVGLIVPIEYKKLKAFPPSKKGSVTKDISVGGVRFTTDEFLSYTARLVLNIALPLPQRPVSAVSKVAWIKKLPFGEEYEIGNQFLEMSKDDKDRLSVYLDDLNEVSNRTR